MRIVQFVDPGQGLRIGVVHSDDVLDITDERRGLRSTLSLLQQAHGEGKDLDTYVSAAVAVAAHRWPYAELDRPPRENVAHLTVPLFPPEVWAAGLTYRRSAEFRSEEIEASGRSDIYDHAYAHGRPELFFKATASRCVGPNDAVGVRSDSVFTAPEPELAVVLAADGTILAYTACNDVSAWDIERENPLFLPQSKIFLGCCALGPTLVTAAEMGEIGDRRIRCRIERSGRTIFDETITIGQMRHGMRELIAALRLNNPIPTGTVLSTGTGIVVSEDQAMQEGDVVEITIDRIGTLRNSVRKLRVPQPV